MEGKNGCRRKGGDFMVGYSNYSGSFSGESKGGNGAGVVVIIRPKGGKRSLCMDLEEVKACRDLGFELEHELMLEMPSATAGLVSFSCSTFDTASSGGDSPIANWRISSPGDDPMDVKARLKVWAQAVALASSSGIAVDIRATLNYHQLLFLFPCFSFFFKKMKFFQKRWFVVVVCGIWQWMFIWVWHGTEGHVAFIRQRHIWFMVHENQSSLTTCKRSTLSSVQHQSEMSKRQQSSRNYQCMNQDLPSPPRHEWRCQQILEVCGIWFA
ncbi:uncharacterized protein LOC120122273 [Hibiscus syriacus]|uniref:uncharacterized protein LOC120122273 n=1 Tax=Hibiscus syriacus TaxID=106335 RepID=UPI0019225624|nr:uncharacterized protein LOC120122273 [Hibiscus syriacus]